jgi:hypothetical protein
MANVTNLLAKLKVSQNSTIQYDNATDFPSEPEEGQICFKGQILFIYATINNISTWFPLTTVRDKHIHSQGAPALTWTVQHDLDSENVIFIVYDQEDTVLNVAPSSQTNDSFELTFQESEAGRCIVFAAREADTMFKMGEMFEKPAVGEDVIVYGNLLPSVDDSWSIGSLGQKWNSMYLSDATLYVGDTVTVSGTGMTIEAPTSPTTLAEQPLFTSSKLTLSEFNYNDGEAKTIKPGILYDAKLEIGTGANSQNISINAGSETGKLVITASNFSIDAAGIVAYSGSMGFSQVSGGVWS